MFLNNPNNEILKSYTNKLLYNLCSSLWYLLTYYYCLSTLYPSTVLFYVPTPLTLILFHSIP